MSKSNINGKVRTDKWKKDSREYLKYTFTHEEIHEKGIELARVSQERTTVESERKHAAATFKARLDGKDAEIKVLGDHINNGYEHRYIDCETRFNDPNTGVKSTYRKDTGEFVRKDPMTPEEMQLELELDKEPADVD